MLTYLAIDWWKVKTSEELVKARAEQLLRRESTISREVKRLRDSRKRSVRYWDQRCANRLRDPLHKGDLVLLYNRSLESQWGKLFANRWNGPYRVVSKFPGGSYQLEELDGTLLRRKAAAQHVKRFYAHGSTSFDETAGSDDDVDMAEAGEDVFEDAAEQPDESAHSDDGGSDSDGSAGEEDAGREEEPGPRRSRRLKNTGELVHSDGSGSDSEGSAGEEDAGMEEEPGPRRSRRLRTAEDSSLKRRVGGGAAGQ
ncbi:hypothetical protein MJO28_014577 [Puccinia striiformis f. sp. tritici]|uniref:Uncharacterized protein n=1 Tax=Puccinia striiformis f. sp. tritici TaxID=168172 RepID=A0ACC0DWT4_9BASI|nr:hypothetical protein MJO28_014577 [Puccinia striiformis f. sp. tritici]